MQVQPFTEARVALLTYTPSAQSPLSNQRPESGPKLLRQGPEWPELLNGTPPPHFLPLGVVCVCVLRVLCVLCVGCVCRVCAYVKFVCCALGEL